MQTFFINENINYNLDEDLETEILLFEKSNLELQLEYDQFFQEAIIMEANILMGNSTLNEGTKFDNFKKFINNAIEWFKKKLKKLKEFIVNIIDKILRRNKETVKELKNIPSTKTFKSNHKYISLTNPAKRSKFRNLVSRTLYSFKEKSTEQSLDEVKKFLGEINSNNIELSFTVDHAEKTISSLNDDLENIKKDYKRQSDDTKNFLSVLEGFDASEKKVNGKDSGVFQKEIAEHQKLLNLYQSTMTTFSNPINSLTSHLRAKILETNRESKEEK